MEVIGEVNLVLRGWSNYFHYGYPRATFRDANHFLRDVGSGSFAAPEPTAVQTLLPWREPLPRLETLWVGLSVGRTVLNSLRLP